MREKLYYKKDIYYFKYKGEINTDNVIEIAKNRALESGIQKLVVASETGRSALRAVKLLKNTNLKLIIVTHYPESTYGPKGKIKIGIPEDLRKFFNSMGYPVIQGTRPFVGVERSYKDGWGGPTPHTYIDYLLGGLFGQGVKIAVEAAIMATDAGALNAGEEIISLAGTFKGLDTAILVKTSYSSSFLAEFEVLEIIAKPRYPRVSTPEYEDSNWRGDLDKYYSVLKVEDYISDAI